jgi:predicted ribosome quality control (RQC) complex YloA/Tae2 family protein
MKEALSSFDVMAVVRDLQQCVGKSIDKVYHPHWDHLILSLKAPGAEKEFVNFHVGKWLYCSKRPKDMPQQPSDFAMMLRKRITNARITAVRQQGFDRIVVLELDKGDRYSLVLELFGDGNVILVKDGAIVQPLTSHTWKHRDVRARRDFAFPPPVPNPTELDVPGLLDLLRTSDSDLVRTLATKLNLGGRYSEEICVRAGLSPGSLATELTDRDSETILTEIGGIVQEIASNRYGFVISKDGAPEDVVPIRLKTYEAMDIEEYDSYSASIEDYVARKPVKKTKKTSDAPKTMGKLKRRLDQQEAAIIRLQDDAREAQIAGDELYARYEQVSGMLARALKTFEDSGPMEDFPGFVRFDQKTAELTVDLGGKEYVLDIKGTVESNAQQYYERAKKARKKLEGLLAVLDDTRTEIDDAEKSTAAKRAKPAIKPSKRFWFEKYRWFISSEGAIVMGGKDAKTNDTLVKKHLGEGDRYAHADIHGAPSVVIKMIEGVTDQTLHEACEFSVATSKAWNAKIGSAAGYWVLPEQVSKTPQSGEFLAKGAFVIRGKRNYSDKLEIKLGIGEIEYEGERKVMGGPESSLRHWSKRFVILRPGELDKDLIAKAIAEELEAPIEEVQSVMPPGNVDIIHREGLKLQGLSPQ